ncbi:MAG: glycosyltransferase family 25 protein [Planctomycetia bacterium]
MQPAQTRGELDNAAFSSRVFVVHVKKGYEARRRSIERQLAALSIPFEFMLDGDISDLDETRMSRWFGPNMTANAVSSCACKHLLVYERLLSEGLPGALVLEDDILLGGNFVDVFNATLAELDSAPTSRHATAWLSYENSTLRMPSRRDVHDEQLLYRANEPRCTGAYYIGAAAARGLLDVASSRKLHEPIDCFVSGLVRSGVSFLDIYWCHPPVAEQGSMNGVFDSMDSRRRSGAIRRMKWLVDKWYKIARHRIA